MSIHLHYTEKGTGAPFILLHGNGEDGTYFKHQVDYFSRKYRVIAVDTRGHGKSPRGTAPFTIRQFAEDLKHFMDRHQIEKADILGFSDGGNIALVFSLKYPEYVGHLILNGANLNDKGVKAFVQIPIVIGYRIASLFAGRSREAARHAEILKLMIGQPDIRAGELQKLRAKTLVIAGRKDMIKESHTRLIYESIPDAQLVLLEGDHFIANKKWKEFNAEVERFLQG